MKLLEGPSEPEYIAFDQCYFVVKACQLKFEVSVAFPIVVAVDQAETGTVTSYVEIAEAGSAETEVASNPSMPAEHGVAALVAELPYLTYAFVACQKHLAQFQEAAAAGFAAAAAAAADADLTYFPGGPIVEAGARALIAGSTSAASVAYSKDYLTELVAQHHSVD